MRNTSENIQKLFVFVVFIAGKILGLFDRFTHYIPKWPRPWITKELRIRQNFHNFSLNGYTLMLLNNHFCFNED